MIFPSIFRFFKWLKPLKAGEISDRFWSKIKIHQRLIEEEELIDKYLYENGINLAISHDSIIISNTLLNI